MRQTSLVVVCFLFLFLMGAVVVGCSNSNDAMDKTIIVAQEEILSIGAGYEAGFWGKGSFYIVETATQTYSLDRLSGSVYTVLNNEGKEDMFYLTSKGNSSISDHELIVLTPETYKELSKAYTKETGETLKNEGITIEEYLAKKNK